MAYDEGLAQRLREALGEQQNVVEKRMFGGIAFMVQGNMSVGVVREDLCVRVGPAANDEALARPHARPMDFTKRPMHGWIFVSPEGYAEDDDLSFWVSAGVSFALSLPAK